MIEKFADAPGIVRSRSLDLDHTSKHLILVSLLRPKPARDTSIKHWRTSEVGH